ncbi:MAG: LPS assembly lipoprotein LptE [Tannerella sp.]|nr:LPS assembly lipoprotein LptE [Tannerella sp.]
MQSSFRSFAPLSLHTIAIWLLIGLTACSISYKFNAGTMDYSKVKSISIKDFPNMATLIHPPLAQRFTEQLREKYNRQTRLEVIRENGTMDLEGEITGYELTPLAVREDMFASQTRLTVTIRVRFTNQVKPEDDFEQSFSAYQEFDSSNPIERVVDELCGLIISEIVDQIYNSTVAKW